MAKASTETPLMKQYYQMKEQHPDAILLYRVGDFYETFSSDAVITSEILGITLTRRAGTELAGFPFHALDTYLPKLVRAGKRVAICEQLEDPKATRKLVKRGITELVTPGVALDDNVLNHKENNFLSAIHFGKQLTGVAFLDISTGEFLTAEGSDEYVAKLMTNFAPKEVLVERGKKKLVEEKFAESFYVFELDDWIFTESSAMDRLLKQFETASLKGFGISSMPAAIIAAGAALQYLDITQHTHTQHITSISRIEEESYVRLDRFTVRNLELTAPMCDDGKSLLDIIDRTVSPMGARLLHRWMLFPLKDPAEINKRLDVVEYFFRHPSERDDLREALEQIGDLERLVGKLSSARITPREVIQLRNSLANIPAIKSLCDGADDPALAAIAEQLNPCHAIVRRITAELLDDAPSALGRGPLFRPGVDAELDELRSIATHGKEYLAALQQRESQRTGIPSLKVAYNNVFGYYLEVTNTHRDKVPAEWIRKQTLVNAERYITPELKEYEEKILGAQERIERIESRLYNDLLVALSEYIPAILVDAQMVARLDVFGSFTRVAIENRYNRPVVDDSLEISITEGRHPVIERQLPPGEPYITNSVRLSNTDAQVMMITGPNMSGKSALLRQTAINVILAQIGCFVAAESAHIGVVDKVFTRVGASDNISLGESTFMVEMNEAASILNNMSERSLILFDELGRGTSTYDGISLAWAIVEYIHEHGGMHPKTLFATHYHELNEMENSFPRIVNYNVSVKEIDGRVVFLRKLAKGGSEHSFGIHVARLAGMPQSIVKRADEVLRHLEKVNRRTDTEMAAALGTTDQQPEEGYQMSFFQLDDPVLEQVRDEIIGLDINNLTPMAALNKLHQIRSIITGK
ncbi:MAG: DNA mismatch repair protein MutS [Duncaniella sp.]|nr:DNA mismatch repair protein MutS [Duncaniella sp.]